MKKIVIVCKFLAAIIIVVIVILHVFTDTTLPAIHLPLLSLLMFLFAYEHKLKKKESKIIFWIFIITGIIGLIVAFDTVRLSF